MCKQYSLPEVMLRIVCQNLSRYKNSAIHLAHQLGESEWLQQLTGVLQFLCLLRMGLGLCPTVVLRRTGSTYTRPCVLPFIRSKTICCTATMLTFCQQHNCSVCVPVVYLDEIQRAIFLLCAGKHTGVKHCPFAFSFL